jgi:hypothetical protein
VGLTQAGIWLAENAPTNSVIVTNVRSQILSYYTNCSFDIESTDWRIDRQNASTIITPDSQTEFSELVDAKKFDYLVVFSEPVAGEFWRRSYYLPYVDEDVLFTIYAPIVEPPFNVTGCESTDDWTVTHGSITFSIDASDTKEGLYSVKAEGMTHQDTGRTRIFYNPAGTWDFSKVDLLNFWFKLDTATNPQYFSVILTDEAGNYRYWLNNTQVFQNWSSGDWQNLEMALDNYEGQEGQFDIEQVTDIAFYVYAAPNTAITYHLDYIQGYSNLKKIYAFPE